MYEGTIWRPPSEARSLIVQASIGCSHNQCAFCISYKGRRYRIRGLEEFEIHVQAVANASFSVHTNRAFLADGNALSIPTDTLLKMISILRRKCPHIARIGIYAYATDCLEKSIDELKSLRKAGLSIAYIGIESGDDRILQSMSKGITNAENIDACLKLRRAGIAVSAIIILGLGGKEASTRHAKATARTINAINPEFLGALTLMFPEGTRLHREYMEGKFLALNQVETLHELRKLINGLDGLEHTIFRTNHASNYLPIRGILSEERIKLLSLLDEVLERPNLAQLLKPESMRGL
ncbi:MAG: radical SAM protein [Candidatus Hodarchaeales archaeon]